LLGLTVGCAKFNVPNEELREAMPPEPAKEIKDLSIKFITANYKLYSCILELNASLTTVGVPDDPETTGELLEYADEFMLETGSALAGVREWSSKNRKKLSDLEKKAPDLEAKEQNVLVNYLAIADTLFQEKQAAYMAAIKAYIGAARLEHEFIKANYSDIVLGLGDSGARYQELMEGLDKAENAFNIALQEVSGSWEMLLESHAKRLGVLPVAADSETRLKKKEGP
jgi:hypothetical protein